MDDRPFQIAMVVQSNTQPPMPDMANALLIEALSRPGVTSMQSLAEALQDLFMRVAERIATDKLTADGSAALADWLMRHNDLFCPPGSRDAANLVADLKPFLSKQSELIARIQPGSQTAPAMLDGSGIDDFLLLLPNRAIHFNLEDVVQSQVAEQQTIAFIRIDHLQATTRKLQQPHRNASQRAHEGRVHGRTRF
jgi:hypothetical protein